MEISGYVTLLNFNIAQNSDLQKNNEFPKMNHFYESVPKDEVNYGYGYFKGTRLLFRRISHYHLKQMQYVCMFIRKSNNRSVNMSVLNFHEKYNFVSNKYVLLYLDNKCTFSHTTLVCFQIQCIVYLTSKMGLYMWVSCEPPWLFHEIHLVYFMED